MIDNMGEVSPPVCPNHAIALTHPPCHATVAGIAHCSLCGEACCPVCGRHKVIQLSRVTGYIQAVSGFNEGKKQELKDRKRYSIGKGELR